MAETKHTPGEWSLDPRVSTRVVAGDRSIATTAGHYSSTVDSTPENEANARIVAAAPDLLAALQSVEWAGSTDDEGGGYVQACPWCGVEKTEQMHDGDCHLAAAIRKALGE